MNAREIALAVVRDVFAPPGSHIRERGAQEALDYRARQARADARDRAFATELAYGAIKMRRALDWYLAPLLGERAATLPPAICEILRLATYEVVYTQADAHATVFEFVNLAKRFGHRGLGNLVNAVLRTLLRAPVTRPQPQDFDSMEEYFGTAYSLPTWLVRQWQGVFGERTEAVCAAVNDPARVAVTVNTMKSNRDEVARTLLANGIVTEPSPLVAESLVAERAGGLPGLQAEADGRWWLQSESSAAVVVALDPHPGEALLDVCSGRGSKSLQMGARLDGSGQLTCVDRDRRKAAVLTQRAAEAEIAAASVIADATLWESPQRFDRALVDAPCSGVGVVGRHPEARWKKQGTDGERLAATQRALLGRTAGWVRGGGTLVYAVCSTDPRETTEVMQWFLALYPFTRTALPPALESFATPEGDVLIPPGIAGRDGFYISSAVRQ